MSLIPGMRLGPYEILTPIGAGGMGEVYRARDTRLDRSVAIKVLPAHLAGNAELKQRFEREARAVSSLNHPHICTLYDVGHHDGTDFLVMEYLEGHTLARGLEKGGLAIDELLRIAIDIADALDKAHSQGVVHRDLKPSNIMLTKSGVKLLDFGLAKATRLQAIAAATVTQSSPLTADGAIVGTFQYMSPEQLEGKDADARSDIFSFGAVLYEMATGRKAFEGKSQASLISAIMTAEPPPVSELQPLAPPLLDRLIRTCLAKDPDSRRQSVHDVLLDLKWISETGSQAGVPTPVMRRREGRERVAWVLAVILLLVLVGSALYFRWTAAPDSMVRAQILPPEKTTFVLGGNISAAPVISSDGQRLAFLARDAEGRAMLWVRPLNSITAQPLAGTERASFPFWSPDSRYLGFFADGKLKKIEASGGPAQVLCSAPGGRGGAWSRDGVIIFAPAMWSHLLKVSASGRPPSRLTSLDTANGHISHRWPQFLPDGRRFLFLARALSAGRSGAYVGSLDGGEPKLLLRGDSDALFSPSGHLLFVRDRGLMAQPFDLKRLELTGEPVLAADSVDVNLNIWKALITVSDTARLVYSAGRTSAFQMLWFDRNGKDQPMTQEAGEYQWPRFSPDGQKVAATISEPHTGNLDIWVFNLSRGIRTRLTFTPGGDSAPVWSPDGTRIAFGSNRKGVPQIYVKPITGPGEEEILLETAADERPISWSRDGRYLAYIHLDSSARSGWDVWVLPLQGERKPFAVLQSEFDELNPMFSPDGRWLAYTSNESGRTEVYITRFPSTGEKIQVSSAGGWQPRWRHDGKEMFYLGLDNKMMVVEILQKGSSMQVGAARPLFQARPVSVEPWASVYDVTPDGKRFVIASEDPRGSSDAFTLVLNWTAALSPARAR